MDVSYNALTNISSVMVNVLPAIRTVASAFQSLKQAVYLASTTSHFRMANASKIVILATITIKATVDHVNLIVSNA
jgi:hypothetical protein